MRHVLGTLRTVSTRASPARPPHRIKQVPQARFRQPLPHTNEPITTIRRRTEHDVVPRQRFERGPDMDRCYCWNVAAHNNRGAMTHRAGERHRHAVPQITCRLRRPHDGLRPKPSACCERHWGDRELGRPVRRWSQPRQRRCGHRLVCAPCRARTDLCRKPRLHCAVLRRSRKDDQLTPRRRSHAP